ncbi:PIG-L family deacetylase, partial [Sphingomonas sp. TPD3009]
IPGRCYRALRRQVARCRDLDLIVGPACDDDHPDHRAVAAAVARCPGGAGRLTYRVWPPRPDRSGPAWRIAVPGGVPVKRSLIHVYRTQLGAVSDDPAGFTIARHELAAFARPVERYRPGSR